MPVKWGIDSNNIVVFIISGKISQAEYAGAKKEIVAVIKEQGEIKILNILENFAGWQGGSGWDDFSFQEENDNYIKGMAFVGDPKWEDQVYAFTLKGLRPVPIKFFKTGEETRARLWLNSEL